MRKGLKKLEYTAPPIIEAVVQLMFEQPLSASRYRKLRHRLKRNYANETPSENINANVDFAKRAATFDAKPQSRFSSADEADILVLQLGSLTWSRLAPYQGWDTFLKRVSEELEQAYAVTGFRALSRIGVRYINRIDIPCDDSGMYKYEDYLQINVNRTELFPHVNKYAWRIEREFAEISGIAIVQSATVAPEIPGTGAVILDIDIVSVADLPLKSEGLYERLNQMRALKNQIFEISISDKARASFTG